MPAHRARIAAAYIALVMAFGAPARAQMPSSSRFPRVVGVDFLVARYTAGATASAYAARRAGAGMAVVGMTFNPETRQRAVIVGGGTHLRLARGTGVTLIVAGASATDGTSLRFYALPSMRAGRVALTATATAYDPLTGTARRKAAIDPLTLSVRLTRGLRLGISGVLNAKQGRLPDFGGGPHVQMRVPGGSLSVETTVMSRSDRVQFRGAFKAAL